MPAEHDDSIDFRVRRCRTQLKAAIEKIFARIDKSPEPSGTAGAELACGHAQSSLRVRPGQTCSYPSAQCEIIHGRLAGKLLEPSLLRSAERVDCPEQQAHPAP